MQMVKMAWDLEDWEFMAVDPTVLELFPCSRQDTVSWAQVTFLSVNPTICSQEGNTVYPLLPFPPTWGRKNLPALQTVPAHSQESVSPPARGAWPGNSQEKLVLNLTPGIWNHICCS